MFAPAPSPLDAGTHPFLPLSASRRGEVRNKPKPEDWHAVARQILRCQARRRILTRRADVPPTPPRSNPVHAVTILSPGSGYAQPSSGSKSLSAAGVQGQPVVNPSHLPTRVWESHTLMGGADGLVPEIDTSLDVHAPIAICAPQGRPQSEERAMCHSTSVSVATACPPSESMLRSWASSCPWTERDVGPRPPAIAGDRSRSAPVWGASCS